MIAILLIILTLIASMIFIGSVDNIVDLWNSSIDLIVPFINMDVLSWNGVESLLTSILEPMKSVAYALAICLWMYGILRVEATLAEMKRPEAVFKHMLRLMIIIFLIEYAPQIVRSVWGIGLALSDIVVGGTVNIGHISSTIFNPVFDGSTFSTSTGFSLPQGWTLSQTIISSSPGGMIIGFIAISLISLACHIGVRIVVLICAYQIFATVISRFFRMILLYIISPIGACASSCEETQRISIQYAKNVIALSSELALTMLLLKIFPVVSTNVVQNAAFIATAKRLIETFIASFCPNDILGYFAWGAIGGVEAAYGGLIDNIVAVLLITLLLFTLKSAIKGLNVIIDSLFGLHGV